MNIRVASTGLIVAGLVTLTGCSSEPMGATVIDLSSKPAYTEEVRKCNGDPVLLICSTETVAREAWWGAEVEVSDTPDGDVTCFVSLTEEQHASLEAGGNVTVTYSVWDGCGEYVGVED